MVLYRTYPRGPQARHDMASVYLHYETVANLTSTRLNTRGYPIGRTDALGQTSTTVYSAANQAVSSTDASGRVTQYEYDAADNVNKIIDPTNQPTLFEYHPIWNKVTKITDALTQVTEFSYNKEGRVRS